MEKMSFKEQFRVWWWYRVEHIFRFSFEISLFQFILLINILTITFKVEIDLPYNLGSHFKNIFCKWKQISENKGIEMELLFSNSFSTGFILFKSIHCHHAATHLQVSILGLSFTVHIYDFRHWDYEKNRCEE
jgi:hypothetical protein